MISIDDHPPSDPSSSHHHHHQHHQKQLLQNPHDPKVSDTDLKSADAANLDDTNNPLPNFSIRDYVFSLRSKNIACNWPFSPKSLQLCLKHGVKNVLPPFQSLDSLRNNSSLTRCNRENRLINEELVSSFDEKSTNDQVKPNGEIVTTNSIGLKGDKESRFHLQPESSQPKSKVKPPSSSQKTENASVHTIIKKSRLLMKVNSTPEQFASNSETMASKVCPVCKIFSSSSNTTLNAHIDQCLTGEGTMKWTDNSKVIVKHKVKPRKVRLIVDIYKTAPHCTVEELDRRNGTSWATNSSFPAQEFQFQGEEAEEEKDESRKTKTNPVVADNEGDVYVDTNGTKVRILSVPKAGPSDNFSGRKLLKGVKGSKTIMGKKKHILYNKKHHKKYLKLSPNARKLCSPKPQAKSGEGEDVGMAENCSEDVQRGRETMKVVNLGIVRPPWACSKRTGLSKKLNSKNQKVKLQCHEKNDLVVENDKSFSGCDLGTPRSSFNIAGSSQSRKKMITSLSLIKQPRNRMVELRKEGIRMHGHALDDNDDDDDDDNDHDDDEDDHDGDDDFEGSLDACPSQHSVDADTRSKGSKFSSLSRNISFPGAKFSFKRKYSAMEKSHVESVDGPSQDSSKERSRIEEHMATKKKEATRSNVSKSSNGESSVGIQTVNGDEFESIRNETSLAIPAPSFIGLSTSFDPEFSKQECIEMYQDQICSTNRAPNDVEKQENYFQRIDPIPIPGPPGSFLPASPGGEMVSEQHIQPTTVHSSENHHHHDTMDQDSMSNSPVSTISNSRSTSAQEETYNKKPFFNGNTGYTETGQSHNSFKNDQPCCCTRKEVALSYQDSYFLMKQPIESNMRTPSSLNFRSETLSAVSNYPTSPAPDSAASPLKPVLRLMGKNLTVVNKTDEEDASLSSQHFKPPQSSQQHPHRPVIYNQYQNGYESHHLKPHPPIHMRSHIDSRPVRGGFMTPADRYGHEYSYLGLGPAMHQARSHHGHNILDSQALNERNVYHAASSSRPVNKTIILDDSPENEADDPLRNDFYKGNQTRMNPLYTMYPSFNGRPGDVGGGSSVFRGGSTFQTSLANGDLGSKWNIGSSTAYNPPSYNP